LRIENGATLQCPTVKLAGIARSVASRYNAPQEVQTHDGETSEQPLRVVSASEFLRMDIKPREMFLDPGQSGDWR
jgi:hypothetical protein